MQNYNYEIISAVFLLILNVLFISGMIKEIKNAMHALRKSENKKRRNSLYSRS